MNQNLSKVQKRAYQYWFVDGLAELAAGLVSLLLAVLFWFWQVVSAGRWSLLVILIAGLGVSLGIRLIIQRIKESSTYLRTGYAAPLSGLERKRQVAILVAFTLLLLSLNYYISSMGSQSLLWSPGLAGLVFAFIFTWTGVSTQLRRFYFLALLSLVAGIVLAILGLEPFQGIKVLADLTSDYFRGVGVLAGIIGLTLLYQGYRVRSAYIDHNPAIDRPVDG